MRVGSPPRRLGLPSTWGTRAAQPRTGVLLLQRRGQTEADLTVPHSDRSATAFNSQLSTWGVLGVGPDAGHRDAALTLFGPEGERDE